MPGGMDLRVPLLGQQPEKPQIPMVVLFCAPTDTEPAGYVDLRGLIANLRENFREVIREELTRVGITDTTGDVPLT